MPEDAPEYMTPQQAIVYLGISRTTFERRIRAARVPVHFRPGTYRPRYFSKADLDALSIPVPADDQE